MKECEVNDLINVQMKLTIIEDLIKGTYESISRIDKKKFIFVPSFFKNDLALVYDFEDKKKVNDLSVEQGTIESYRLTDATDIESDGSFWLLGIRFIDVRKSLETVLIKAMYDETNKKITLINKYILPIKDLFFEGLVKVSEDEFFICADNKYKNIDKMYNKKYGLVYAIIGKDLNDVIVQPLDIKCGDWKMMNWVFNSRQFSSMFKYDHGIGLIPQRPEAGTEYGYGICNNEIERIRNIIKLKTNDHEIITVEASIRFDCYYSESKMNNYIINEGIEAATFDENNNLYGITTCIYPYYINGTEKAPGDQIFVLKLMSGKFPEGYERSKAGLYIRPFIGTMK